MADLTHADPHHAEAGHGHHQHSSVWPFITGTGLTVATIGFIPLIQQSPVGYMVVVIGAFFFLIGIAGWMYTLSREHALENAGGAAQEFPRIGWWLVGFLILSEVFLFGSLFASYFYLRNTDWVRSGLNPQHFWMAGGTEVVNTMGDAPIRLPFVNTFLLVSSSVVIWFAERAMKQGKLRLFQVLMAVTILEGIGFVAVQVYEFANFALNEGFSIHSGPFGATFFSLTGLHGLHVTAGVILLSYVLATSFFGSVAKGHYQHRNLAIISIYWHFVDVIWLALLSILYLRLV